MAERPESRPAWWQFPWKEIASFLVGGAILLWQTVIEPEPKAILVGAGLALMGITGTGGIQRAARRALDRQ